MAAGTPRAQRLAALGSGWQRHFPFPPMSAPRATARSWHVRARAYKRWRDAVRVFIGPPTHDVAGPLVVRIICLDWNAQGDPDNVAKAVLDALQPWPLANDTWQQVAMVSCCRSQVRQRGAGFHVELEPWCGVLGEGTLERTAPRLAGAKGAGGTATPPSAGKRRRRLPAAVPRARVRPGAVP